MRDGPLDCVEQLEQALCRRGFTFEEDKGRWVKYPPNNGAGKAVVVAQEQVEKSLAFERASLLFELDRLVDRTREDS